MATEKQKKAYQSYYEIMTKKNKGKPPRHTWTEAQYVTSSPQQQQLAHAGIEYKKVKRMK